MASREALNLTDKGAKVKVYGKHYYGNLYGCNVEKLKDEEYLRDLVVEAAKVGNMTLLDVKSWKMGEGVSVVAIVLESHITIHTWPEFAFATVDVYSCGSHTDPRKAFEFIVRNLEAKKVVGGNADRSLVEGDGV
ncbi:TPA: adenosylmethionine decarboxylase [Desulfurococcaceae archaeon]|nr:adenosylmethionine decarboxylase [Desulfurococcaceae archaeon]